MPRSSGLLEPLRTGFSVLTGSQAVPGVLLLADLRQLHRMAAGALLDWELLAQAVKDSELMATHPAVPSGDVAPAEVDKRDAQDALAAGAGELSRISGRAVGYGRWGGTAKEET